MGDLAEKPECDTLDEDGMVWDDVNMARNAFLIFDDGVRMRETYCGGGKGANVFEKGGGVMPLR